MPEGTRGRRFRVRTRVRTQQAYVMMANLVQELRNEEQFMADFVNGVV